MQEFKYSLRELEEMLPWQREIYINLLIDHLDKKRQQGSNKVDVGNLL